MVVTMVVVYGDVSTLFSELVMVVVYGTVVFSVTGNVVVYDV